MRYSALNQKRIRYVPSYLLGSLLFTVFCLIFFPGKSWSQTCTWDSQDVGVSWSFSTDPTDSSTGKILVYVAAPQSRNLHEVEVELLLSDQIDLLATDFSSGFMGGNSGNGGGILSGTTLFLNFYLDACGTTSGTGLWAEMEIASDDGSALPSNLVQGGVGIIVIDDLH